MSFTWFNELSFDQTLQRCLDSRVNVLNSQGAPTVMQGACEAVAAGYVRKREIATKLLPNIDAVLARPRHPTAGNGTD